MGRPIAMTTAANAGPSSTATLIVESSSPETSAASSQPQALTLKLVRKKKKVTWKEGTVDNEFMNKKSSKKCCIFHKDKPFDEDDSNEDHGHGDGCCSDDVCLRGPNQDGNEKHECEASETC